ncbi:hypothetical protein BDY19DRAFT_920673 [Irpex rosettiformis]|uniref:Uncharacterized protein n=1 Tax=Irpex rosettiformis TaxID=378272 RepID=A0ACB8UJ18_9APHY|nr:hypothetical protein BDY19DRAFT_920673 [Irpex rosettiformis]
MLEIISILQNFQKKKTTKGSDKPSSFTLKKNVIYEEARKNANNAVQEGVAYIEQYRIVIEALKAQEVSQSRRLEELSLFTEQENSVRNILDQFPPLFEELSRRRAETVNDTSATLESHSIERQRSRRRLIKNATMRIEADYEHQRVVTDASALIKHYKALLLS